MNRLKFVELKKIKESGRFLVHQEYEVKHIYKDGEESKAYRYEVLTRKDRDAVVVIPFYLEGGKVYVGLVRILRISKLLRENKENDGKIKAKKGFLNEAIAGILEKGEETPKRIRRRALIELKEEGGIEANENELIPLGPPFFTSPGQSTEKIYPFAVELKEVLLNKRMGDGSIIERDMGELYFIELKDFFKMLKNGEIVDAKTEIAVIRLIISLFGVSLDTSR